MFRMLFLGLVILELVARPLSAAVPRSQAFGERRPREAGHRKENLRTAVIAGLDVAYWLPDESAFPAPLVIFSHGLNGCKTQSTFLTQALASHGYVAVAPDHRDALCDGAGRGSDPGAHRPQARLVNYDGWTDKSHADRGADIKNLQAALKEDAAWRVRIDWDRVALAGHSLGGYTTVGLAGGWPSWKMPGIRAVLALSPYVGPLVVNGDLAHIGVPIMYQTGTLDLGVAPSLKRKGGAFEQTPSPAWLVEFERIGHFGWTDLQSAAHQRIVRYSLWFLDHTLKGSQEAIVKETGVTLLRTK